MRLPRREAMSAYFSACWTGRSCSPAGPEVARDLRTHPGDRDDGDSYGRWHERCKALFPRSAQFAAESDRNHKLLFGDSTPDGLLKLLTGQDLAERLRRRGSRPGLGATGCETGASGFSRPGGCLGVLLGRVYSSGDPWPGDAGNVGV